MRYGFTTGSCAAAAAKAAAYMLLTGKIKNCITIETPKGIPYTAEVTDIVRGNLRFPALWSRMAAMIRM